MPISTYRWNTITPVYTHPARFRNFGRVHFNLTISHLNLLLLPHLIKTRGMPGAVRAGERCSVHQGQRLPEQQRMRRVRRLHRRQRAQRLQPGDRPGLGAVLRALHGLLQRAGRHHADRKVQPRCGLNGVVCTRTGTYMSGADRHLGIGRPVLQKFSLWLQTAPLGNLRMVHFSE